MRAVIRFVSRRRITVAATAAAAALALAGDQAVAYTNVCDEEPAAYAGTTYAEQVAWDGYAETLRLCNSVQERVEQLHADLAALPDIERSASAGAADAALTAQAVRPLEGKLDDLNDAITFLNAVVAEMHADLTTRTLSVAISNPQEGEESAAAVDALGEALHADVWFLIGLATSALASYAVYRLVMPRA